MTCRRRAHKVSRTPGRCPNADGGAHSEPCICGRRNGWKYPQGPNILLEHHVCAQCLLPGVWRCTESKRTIGRKGLCDLRQVRPQQPCRPPLCATRDRRTRATAVRPSSHEKRSYHPPSAWPLSGPSPGVTRDDKDGFLVDRRRSLEPAASSATGVSAGGA